MQELGERHAHIGVEIEYFPVMGEGLVHALEVMLKNDFKDETREALLAAYSRMSSKVIAVMRAEQNKT